MPHAFIRFLRRTSNIHFIEHSNSSAARRYYATSCAAVAHLNSNNALFGGAIACSIIARPSQQSVHGHKGVGCAEGVAVGALRELRAREPVVIVRGGAVLPLQLRVGRTRRPPQHKHISRELPGLPYVHVRYHHPLLGVLLQLLAKLRGAILYSGLDSV